MIAKFATCRHTKTNGRVCQSPALTGGALCFFHNKLHQTHRRPADPEPLTSHWQEEEILETWDPSGEDPIAVKDIYPRQDDIRFPPLEDAESVQLATSMLFQAIATGQIEFKRARLLIATLKIACINQRALTLSRAAEQDPPNEETGCPMFDEVDHGVTTSSNSAATPKPSNSQPEIPPTPAQSNSLKLSNLQLETHSQSTNPPPNPNQTNILDLTHLDTGFCRKRHRPNH